METTKESMEKQWTEKSDQFGGRAKGKYNDLYNSPIDMLFQNHICYDKIIFIPLQMKNRIKVI